jgi:hypothetical protein
LTCVAAASLLLRYMFLLAVSRVAVALPCAQYNVGIEYITSHTSSLRLFYHRIVLTCRLATCRSCRLCTASRRVTSALRLLFSEATPYVSFMWDRNRGEVEL